MDTWDWAVVAAYVAAMLAVGVFLARRGGRDVESFFAAGRGLPWWLAGTSMLATTFASDTPLMVTEQVRTKGLWGNWLWWGFGISHALAAAVFVAWWRRSSVLTEAELAERRYSGHEATLLRGVKAIYWGILFNAVVMGSLPMAAMGRILAAFAGWDDPEVSLRLIALVVLAYGAVSGLWGVVVTDLLQFGIAMVCAVVLAALAVPAAGGWEAIMAAAGSQRLTLLPSPSGEFWKSDFVWVLGFLVVQWWAFKNSDGGPIFAQRALACRDERHAMGAMIWFLVAHYAGRVWPWAIVALASLVVMPQVEAVAAYPAMAAELLPAGLRGLMLAGFLAAFMSTMDTHMNWGASLLTHDLYRRFVRPAAGERELVWFGRLGSVALLALAVQIAEAGGSLAEAFQMILNLTAGVGPVYLARWLWWRTNAWSELAAMAGSLATFLSAEPVAAALGIPLGNTWKLLWVTLGTAAVWIPVTLATPPVDAERLREFYRRVRPFRWGWAPVARGCPEVVAGATGPALARWMAAVAMTFGWTLGTGWLLFGPPLAGVAAVLVGTAGLMVFWRYSIPRAGGASC